MSIIPTRRFSGIDTRKALSADLSTCSDMHDLRITAGGSLEKRAKTQFLSALSGTVEGLWCGSLNGSDIILASAGGTVYSLDPITRAASALGYIGKGECLMFEFGGCVYIKTKDYYGKYDGGALTEVEGYIPCVAISCTPNGEGELFETVNLLTDKRRQLFSGDGASVTYRLAEKNLISAESIKINGEEYTGNYMLDSLHGEIIFEKAPEQGLNNIEITYRAQGGRADKGRILNCRRALLFGGNSDGRVFLYGNDDYPNCRFYSQLASGEPSVEYFPADCYSVIGSSKINCIVQQYDRQLIFTKNEAFYSYCELREDALGNIVSSFPVFSLNNGKGCLFETDGCVINNRPVTLCDDGLNLWESTGIENEKNALCFSQPISGLLLSSLTLGSELHTFDLQSENELFFVVNGRAFIYNYALGVWYSYDGFGGKYFTVHRDTVYFANGSGIYAYSEHSEPVYGGYMQSGYIGNENGDFDIALIESDIRVNGEVTVKFTLEKSNGELRERSFAYNEKGDRLLRISFRPAIKRATPFRIRVLIEGSGSCTLHGITLKTRNKERSRRFGLL